MPLIEYATKRFRPDTLQLIEQANVIIAQYAEQGYDLTLRQLYYQFVARDLLPNRQAEYNRLGSIINDARLAGLVDWSAIVDRTRHERRNPHWTGPVDIVRDASEQFAIDKWADQHQRCEVWIEKDALVGILQTVCEPLDVPYFSCRGYSSVSALWRAAQRILTRLANNGQPTVILHLGDHDPSGLDMTRDVRDRLALFCEHHGWPGPVVHRIALNMDQIEQYDPPPNPAKNTDSRYDSYSEEYGDESWELDALDPDVLAQLIQTAVAAHRNDELWEASVELEQAMREEIADVVAQWQPCVTYAQDQIRAAAKTEPKKAKAKKKSSKKKKASN